MSKATSAPAGASSPPLRAVPDYRVIYHAQLCPDCGSDDITESEVETGEGITEIALTCKTCGTAWPVACVVDWSTRP
jgi:transcription elongation factor Elf1